MGEALFEQLEIAEADLLDTDSLGNEIEGVNYVILTVSPFI